MDKKRRKQKIPNKMDGAPWYYKWDGMVLGMRWMSLGGLRKRAPNALQCFKQGTQGFARSCICLYSLEIYFKATVSSGNENEKG